MEIENVEVSEEVSPNQEPEVLGGADIDIVIEELNGGDVHAEEPDDGNNSDRDENVNMEKVDQIENEEFQNTGVAGNEEIENADRDDDSEGENTQYSEDTGADTVENVNDDENETNSGDNVDILKERENEISIKSVEVDVQEKVTDVPAVETKTANEVTKEHIPEEEENKENGGVPEANNNSVKSSISKFGAPVKRKEKGMFKVVQLEKCAACQKTVYAMEKLEMNGHIYHKNCFKCSHCSARLTAKTFSMNEGVIYCVNHFKQLFARKGNYDEGFGRQQYKKKWQGDKPEGATA